MLDALISGVIASLVAVAMLEVVLIPIWRRCKLSRIAGKYYIHRIDGKPIVNQAGEQNYAILKVAGWFSQSLDVSGFDYDTNKGWKGAGSLDYDGQCGSLFYSYDNKVDAGEIRLFKVADAKFAARTYAFHANEAPAFFWTKTAS